jgi:hypothetical protein
MNVAIEWLTLHRIPGIPGSTHDPKAPLSSLQVLHTPLRQMQEY